MTALKPWAAPVLPLLQFCFCCATPAVLPLLCSPCCVPPAVLTLLCSPAVLPLLCYPCCATPAVLPLLCGPCATPALLLQLCYPCCAAAAELFRHDIPVLLLLCYPAVLLMLCCTYCAAPAVLPMGCPSLGPKQYPNATLSCCLGLSYGVNQAKTACSLEPCMLLLAPMAPVIPINSRYCSNNEPYCECRERANSQCLAPCCRCVGGGAVFSQAPGLCCCLWLQSGHSCCAACWQVIPCRLWHCIAAPGGVHTYHSNCGTSAFWQIQS